MRFHAAFKVAMWVNSNTLRYPYFLHFRALLKTIIGGLNLLQRSKLSLFDYTFFCRNPANVFLNRILQPHLGKIVVRGGFVEKFGQHLFTAENLIFAKKFNF